MQGDLSALIERVEKATGPDRGLSCAIGSFFGWQFEHKDGAWNKRPDVVFTLGLPDYTASLDAALELVEQQMAIEWPQYEVHARMIRSGDEWFHYWEITVPSREFQGRSKTPALALLQCLLRALQSLQADRSPSPAEVRKMQGERPDDVVGHKTLADGSHQPLLRAEAQALLKACDDDRAKREAIMPDEKAALRMFVDAYVRLMDFGFREAIYCPKDGSHFQAIEAGSTGIHDCRYDGEWPTGSWWIHGDGDIWPSRPVLHRLYPEDEAKRKAKMEEAWLQFQADRSSSPTEGDGNG